MARFAPIDERVPRSVQGPGHGRSRMVMRTPGANDNTVIYNDLARLEETLTTAASDYMARKAAEEAKPVPKTKKYYKELKEKQAKEQVS